MTGRTLLAVVTAACILAAPARAQPNRAPAPARGSGSLLPPAAIPAQPAGRQGAPAPAAPARTVPVAPSETGQPVNIKVEFTITDQRGGEPPVKRTVSVVAADRNLGRVRSIASVFISGESNSREIPLNVDATPTVLSDGKIRLQFTLSYDLPVPAERSNPPTNVGFRITKTDIQNSLSLVLADGKSMIAAQSADTIGDRQVTVEVKATVLK